MNSTHLFSIALVAVALGTSSWAAQHDQHSGHHPAGAASAPAAKAKPVKTSVEMTRMDSQTKAMRLVHDKLVVAKTPEERAVLMVEHSKIMQEGMTMMNGMATGGMSGMSGMSGMGGMKGDMAVHHQTMEKRMEMMQAMMQLMMDRMPAAPAR